MYTLMILAALGQFPLLNQQAAGPWPSFLEPPRILPQADRPQANRSADGVVLLAITSTWCGPCARTDPLLEAIEAEGVVVRRIDYDLQQPLALAHNVTTLPTMIVLEHGVEVDRCVGVPSLDQLREITRRPVPEPADARPVEALPVTGCEPAGERVFRWRGRRQRR